LSPCYHPMSGHPGIQCAGQISVSRSESLWRVIKGIIDIKLYQDTHSTPGRPPFKGILTRLAQDFTGHDILGARGATCWTHWKSYYELLFEALLFCLRLTCKFYQTQCNTEQTAIYGSYWSLVLVYLSPPPQVTDIYHLFQTNKSTHA